MSKKAFNIISTCCVVALIITFSLVMRYIVGEEALSTKGPMKTLWIIGLVIILNLSFVRDFIIKRKYGNHDKK